MAREKGPLGRKCLVPRKDHRKSVRPLRNAGKEARGGGVRMREENEKNGDAPRGRERLEEKEKKCSLRRKSCAGKRGGEKIRGWVRPAWLVRVRKNASILPPTMQRQLNRQAIVLSFPHSFFFSDFFSSFFFSLFFLFFETVNEDAVSKVDFFSIFITIKRLN